MTAALQLSAQWPQGTQLGPVPSLPHKQMHPWELPGTRSHSPAAGPGQARCCPCLNTTNPESPILSSAPILLAQGWHIQNSLCSYSVPSSPW